MLSADIYRYGMKYPPTGSAWMQFGDKELDRAMSAISQDIQRALHQKKEAMRPMHEEKLQKLGHTPVHQPQPQFYSIADQPPLEVAPEEEVPQEQVAPTPDMPEPGPSRLQQAGRFVQNFAWPITRDILGPATLDLAGHLTKAGLYLAGKTAWSLADVMFAIGGAEGEESEGAPAEQSYPMLGDGEDPAQEQRINELAGKGKGWLIEQIYSKPGWLEALGLSNERGYRSTETADFRKKLAAMSTHELGKILVALS